MTGSGITFDSGNVIQHLGCVFPGVGFVTATSVLFILPCYDAQGTARPPRTLRCLRSTPTERQSMSEKDFECFANGSKHSWDNVSEFWHAMVFHFLEADFWPASLKVCSGAQLPGSPSSKTDRRCAGRHRPHPRHWMALAELADIAG